jgi:nitronate monooxygenase
MVDKIHSSPRARAKALTDRLGLRLPILLAPMAGACPPSLSIAVANAGGWERAGFVDEAGGDRDVERRISSAQ